jgi:hypothetical protein
LKAPAPGRTARDQARELEFPSRVAQALRRAYTAGGDLNSRIAIVDASLAKGVPGPTVITFGEAKKEHDDLSTCRTARLAQRAPHSKPRATR